MNASHAVLYRAEDDEAEPVARRLASALRCGLLPDRDWLRSAVLHFLPGNDGRRPRVPILVGHSRGVLAELAVSAADVIPADGERFAVSACAYTPRVWIPGSGLTQTLIADVAVVVVAPSAESLKEAANWVSSSDGRRRLSEGGAGMRYAATGPRGGVEALRVPALDGALEGALDRALAKAGAAARPPPPTEATADSDSSRTLWPLSVPLLGDEERWNAERLRVVCGDAELAHARATEVALAVRGGEPPWVQSRSFVAEDNGFMVLPLSATSSPAPPVDRQSVLDRSISDVLLQDHIQSANAQNITDVELPTRIDTDICTLDAVAIPTTEINTSSGPQLTNIDAAYSVATSATREFSLACVETEAPSRSVGSPDLQRACGSLSVHTARLSTPEFLSDVDAAFAERSDSGSSDAGVTPTPQIGNDSPTTSLAGSSLQTSLCEHNEMHMYRQSAPEQTLPFPPASRVPPMASQSASEPREGINQAAEDAKGVAMSVHCSDYQSPEVFDAKSFLQNGGTELGLPVQEMSEDADSLLASALILQPKTQCDVSEMSRAISPCASPLVAVASVVWSASQSPVEVLPEAHNLSGSPPQDAKMDEILVRLSKPLSPAAITPVEVASLMDCYSIEPSAASGPQSFSATICAISPPGEDGHADFLLGLPLDVVEHHSSTLIHVQLEPAEVLTSDALFQLRGTTRCGSEMSLTDAASEAPWAKENYPLEPLSAPTSGPTPRASVAGKREGSFVLVGNERCLVVKDAGHSLRLQGSAGKPVWRFASQVTECDLEAEP